MNSATRKGSRSQCSYRGTSNGAPHRQPLQGSSGDIRNVYSTSFQTTKQSWRRTFVPEMSLRLSAGDGCRVAVGRTGRQRVLTAVTYALVHKRKLQQTITLSEPQLLSYHARRLPWSAVGRLQSARQVRPLPFGPFRQRPFDQEGPLTAQTRGPRHQEQLNQRPDETPSLDAASVGRHPVTHTSGPSPVGLRRKSGVSLATAPDATVVTTAEVSSAARQPP